MSYGDFKVDDLVIPKNDFTQTGFIHNNIVDWYAAISKTEHASRPGANGDFDVTTDYYDSLKITLEGVYIGEDAYSTARAKSLLKSRKRGGRYITVSYEDGAGVTTRRVKVKRVHIPHTSDPTSFSWALDMTADDPIRYGLPTGARVFPQGASGGGLVFPLGGASPAPFLDWGVDAATGRFTITNTGDEPVFADFWANGGMEAFAITSIDDGRVLRLDRLVPVGSRVYLNQRTRRVVIDGQSDIGGQLTMDQWTAILPGETKQYQFTPIGNTSGTPSLDYIIRPGF